MPSFTNKCLHGGYLCIISGSAKCSVKVRLFWELFQYLSKAFVGYFTVDGNTERGESQPPVDDVFNFHFTKTLGFR